MNYFKLVKIDNKYLDKIIQNFLCIPNLGFKKGKEFHFIAWDVDLNLKEG